MQQSFRPSVFWYITLGKEKGLQWQDCKETYSHKIARMLSVQNKAFSILHANICEVQMNEWYLQKADFEQYIKTIPRNWLP